MRPLRLAILLVCFVVLPTVLTFASLLSAHPRTKLSASGTVNTRKTGLRALFSFGTPSSLFPPSAIISLTDDNSTFFVARPAAFGPLLPSKSLSGQLWVGSGFGDDSARKGGVIAGAEGELGCSDIPGWREEDGSPEATSKETAKKQSKGKGSSRKSSSSKKVGKENNAKRSDDFGCDSEDSLATGEDDGTDDFLHQNQLRATLLPRGDKMSSRDKASEHADIQSLQESAEIAGKVVLLSRGGCGFLEKAKWTQRRGGIALIVGDNTRGGGLVTMYARGDTSNVSIPSLFTSHTTAHLLSSLIPSDVEDGQHDGRPKKSRKGGQLGRGKKGSQGRKGKETMKSKHSKDRAVFTPTNALQKATDFPKRIERIGDDQDRGTAESDGSVTRKENDGLVRTLLSALGFGGDRLSPDTINVDKHRPPSSGQLKWTIVEEWIDEEVQSESKSPVGATERESISSIHKSSTETPNKDNDFVIGVHDWRDPDLIGELPSKESEKNAKHTSSPKTGKASAGRFWKSPKEDTNKQETKSLSNSFEGGSITPGSGEYRNPATKSVESSPKHIDINSMDDTLQREPSKKADDIHGSWLDSLPWSKSSDEEDSTTKHSKSSSMISDEYDESMVNIADIEDLRDASDGWEGHDGLWVTLTPTSMSSSPFFDTLLVLVVSPLVTLTVVYALLLLRSRLRRRRWRAPKSVVERLPVRTYRTISSQASSSARVTTSSSSPSPTSSPFIQPESPSNRAVRARPRSRTTSGIPAYTDNRSGSLSPPQDVAELADLSDDEEKANTSWRRPYTGKQVECVVCLEEYIDGVSRVMSLPCGHEFHAECITPWLTMRRRTCPICKGDVVRSLARGSRPSPQQAPYRDIPQDEVQSQAAETRNESPSSAMPITRLLSVEEESDLERDGSSIRSSEVSTSLRNRWSRLGVMSLGSLRGISAALGGEPSRHDNDEQDRRR